MLRLITLNVILLFLAFSCAPKEMEVVEEVELSFQSIEFSLLCGWCVEGERIIIREDNTIQYYGTDPCEPEIELNKSERELSASEVDKLNNIFSFEVFRNVDLDKCGACYDGCENKLTIQMSEETSHTILYDTPNDHEELTVITELVSFLNDTRNSF